MRILVVDDDALVRDSLALLVGLEPDMEVVARAADGEAALAACEVPEDRRPELVLMDIRMPVLDGVEATRRIKARFPSIRVVMLTTFHDDDYIRSALQAGAEGYLLKSTPADGIVERLRAVHKGAAVMDRAVLDRLARPADDGGSAGGAAGGHGGEAGGPGGAGADTPVFPELTGREREVLELVAQGSSNREIAHRLYLGEGTVRNLISSILDKLSLRDRTQLAVAYWKRYRKE